jgi:hypothetical protein
MDADTLVYLFGGGALLLFAIVYFFFDRLRKDQQASLGTESQPGKDADATPKAPDSKGSTADRRGIGRPFSITFARLFGLLTVAVLGAGLALSGQDPTFLGSAFTLLGTVAGYLAGAKPTAPAPGEPTDAHL